MFDVSKFVGGFISPKVGLALVRNRLQSELNTALRARAKSGDTFTPLVIKAYKLVIDNTIKKVYFVVDRVTIPYNDGEELSNIINTMVSQKIKNATIDVIIIEYDTDNAPVLTVAYTKDGAKESKQITL